MPLNEKLDRTTRVVRVAARLAEVVLRKDSLVDRIAKIFGDRIIDQALEDLEGAIDRKLSKGQRSFRVDRTNRHEDF